MAAQDVVVQDACQVNGRSCKATNRPDIITAGHMQNDKHWDTAPPSNRRSIEDKEAFAKQQLLNQQRRPCELRTLKFLFNIRSLIPTYKPQVYVHGWLVDFFFPTAATVLEVNGSWHYQDDVRKKDAMRTASLINAGYSVFTMWNSTVMQRGLPNYQFNRLLTHLRDEGHLNDRPFCSFCGEVVNWGKMLPYLTEAGVFCDWVCSSRSERGAKAPKKKRPKLKHKRC